MGLDSKVDDPKLAIFTRNHRGYLEEAVRKGEAVPGKQFVLRSK